MNTETIIQIDLENAKVALARHVSRIGELRQQLRDEQALEVIARRVVHRFEKRKIRFKAKTQ